MKLSGRLYGWKAKGRAFYEIWLMEVNGFGIFSRYPFTLGDALRESSPARPTAQTSTLTAPPSRRIWAHSATVLPVVITSSINATRAPGNVCPIAKAPSGIKLAVVGIQIGLPECMANSLQPIGD